MLKCAYFYKLTDPDSKFSKRNYLLNLIYWRGLSRRSQMYENHTDIKYLKLN